MIEITSQEVVENGKSIVYYKFGLTPKKCLMIASNFERAIAAERIIKKAISWKRFHFVVETIKESWDRKYYNLKLNEEFLSSDSNLNAVTDLAADIVNKLSINKAEYTIEFRIGENNG